MLTLIIIASLAILGFYAAMGEGMILERLLTAFEYITRGALRPIRPALYECPVCMASIWGTAIWFANGSGDIVHYVVFIFGVAGFNYLAMQLTGE